MVEKKITIKFSRGIHSRPAALIVQAAGKFSSVILIKKDDKEVNAKSIMGLMSLSLSPGNDVVIRVEGSDEQEAMEKICSLLTSELDGE